MNCVVDHYESRANQSKELREKRATRAELGRKKRKVPPESKSERPQSKSPKRSGSRSRSRSASKSKPAEDLSFESLTRDEAPPAVPIPEYSATPPEDMDDGPTAFYDKEALNKRVLTGSARRGSPAGITGLGLGVASWVILLFAYRATDMGGQRGILILLAFILSAGTVVWTGAHAFSKEKSIHRLAARVGLAVGGSAFLLTLLIYVVRAME